MKRATSLDWTIPVLILLLQGLGAAIIGSVSPDLLGAQLGFYLLGWGLFFFFCRLDLSVVFHLKWHIYFAAILLLLITMIIGVESRGATRWINIGPFRAQFSELLKPFLIASFAVLISQNKLRGFGLIKCLVIIVVPVLLVLRQPDLGSAIVYFVAVLSMLFVGGLPVGYIVFGVVSLLAALPFGWHFLADYQKQRIEVFLGSSVDPLGTSYNTIQAMIAVGSGMLLGRGLGRGTQSQLLFLPEHHTDFVFASLSEELGFLGAFSLVLIYFLLIWKGTKIIMKTTNPVHRLLGSGIVAMLFAQVFVNVGMNLGIVPVTGITLPLVSYGGSSVLATMMILGMLENIGQAA